LNQYSAKVKPGLVPSFWGERSEIRLSGK